MEKEINSGNRISSQEYPKKEFQEEAFDINKIYETLKRRRRILFSVAFFVFSLGVFNTINQRIKNPIFKGEFSLLISDPIKNDNESMTKNRLFSNVGDTQRVDVSTLIEVLKSPSLLSEIASKYNLTFKDLSGSIKINSVFNKAGKARGVLEISVESNDPKKLKLILNELSTAYINASVKERQKRLLDGINFLSTQEPTIKQNVISLQDELQKLRKKHKFIVPEENLEKTYDIRQRLARRKLIFKEDSNLVLSLEEKLDKDFEIKPAVQREYEEIILKLDYAITNLELLTAAKENFKLSLAQTSVPWKVIYPPTVGSKPIKPSISFNLATSLVFAFLVGAAAALTRERFDYVYHDVEEINKSFDLPVLGNIPYYSALVDLRGSKKNILKVLEDPFSNNQEDSEEENLKIKNYESFSIQEAFRNLYTNLKFIDDKKKSHSFLISSSIPAEGKSILNIILAKTIADLGLKVLLIDCDLRKSQVHQRLGMNNLKGFTDLFFDKNYLWENAVQPVKNCKNLSVITSGSKIIDPVRILSSEKTKNIINEISNSEKYDYVIYDAPPVYTFPDASYIAKNIDGLLLMISLNQVDKDIPIKVVDKLKLSGVDIFGIVANSSKYIPLDKSSISYYYSSYYDSSENDKKDINDKIDSKLVSKLNDLKDKLVKKIKKFVKWMDA